jgi:hypothetical protein
MSCKSLLNQSLEGECIDYPKANCVPIANDYSASLGYNYIKIEPPILVSSSELIEVRPYEAQIAIDTSNTAEYSDVQTCPYERIDKSNTYRMFVQAFFVPEKITIKKTFNTPGKHRITGAISDNSLSGTGFIEIKMSKNFNL